MSPFIFLTIVYPVNRSNKRDIIMKILKFLLTLFFSSFFVSAFAQPNFSGFMTARDLLNRTSNEATSNLSLQNNRNSATTVYGLYVRQYAYVLPGQSCDNATIIYPANNNITAGAFLMPTVINPEKKAIIGGNYLYNMLYEAIYYENIIIPSSPPGCALPVVLGEATTRNIIGVFI